MPLAIWDELFSDADRLRQAVPVGVAGGADSTVLEALRNACDRGWITPRVIGREPEVRRTASEHGISLAGFTILDAEDAASAAVAEVRSGQARLLMKGQIATPALMKAILHPEDGLRTRRTICQVVLMAIQPAGRRFLLADTGICVRPSLAQKCDILASAAGVAQRLGAAPVQSR